MSRGYVVPQCPIADDATDGGPQDDISHTVHVYGSHNTQTTVRLFIVCIGRQMQLQMLRQATIARMWLACTY